MMLMLNRGFFSLQAPWTPTAVAAANLILNTGLYVAFHRLGVWGIPLAISLANIATALALLFLLRRRAGRLELGDTARSFARVVVASGALAASAYLVWRMLDDALGRSLGGQVASLGAALVVGLGAYLFCCRLLQVRELETLLSLRARFRRK